jgi:putative endonuclease
MTDEDRTDEIPLFVRNDERKILKAHMDKTFHVYLLASESGVLYVGVTSNLLRRVSEHKERKIESFTKRYNVTKLVWFELHGTAASAISREKEIKAWRRSKKAALIDAKNPKWKDLIADLR